jgi:hypothetical protein
MIIPLLPTFFLPDFDFPTTSATTWEIDPTKMSPQKVSDPRPHGSPMLAHASWWAPQVELLGGNMGTSLGTCLLTFEYN